jgi:hypothetical protein
MMGNGTVFLLTCGLVFSVGCQRQLPKDALVLTQTPISLASAQAARSLLDERYPIGSRLVLAVPPFDPSRIRVLSLGLISAGEPVVRPDGQSVLFSGKASESDPWQIYEVKIAGGRPRVLTTLPGGAMNPAVLANGDVVFSSPVPKSAELWTTPPMPALYAQGPGARPRRLTYGTSAAMEPAVLADGRILFVAAHAKEAGSGPPSLGLFTINNDGTEVTAFAADHDGNSPIRRPREIPGGRVAFLGARGAIGPPGFLCVEAVRMARPFASRASLFCFPIGSCSSVEPDGQGKLLLSVNAQGFLGRSMSVQAAVYRVDPSAPALGRPLFQAPNWHSIEAVALAPRIAPMGHLSVMSPEKNTGTILCLNANFTRDRPSPAEPQGKAARVRVSTRTAQGECRVLGEVAIQTDGSFMTEVPADVPLGFETLAVDGQLLQHVPPSIWVRPGENRSCVGCHEPSNHSPRNVRPLAVTVEPVVLEETPVGRTHPN